MLLIMNFMKFSTEICAIDYDKYLIGVRNKGIWTFKMIRCQNKNLSLIMIITVSITTNYFLSNILICYKNMC